ncbi:WD40 repeat domain-containing protein [Sphaerisporangium aureirubrum]|uniref:Uncharacterized protein n=1 Tax=Sphaerisporangium aureirubrum TaxID=1544736 RepID=A0ABW1NB03_9ACTN
MTGLRQVLNEIADDAPPVDLADRVLRAHAHRRRTTMALVAAGTVVFTLLGVTAGVRLMHDKPVGEPASGTVTDLPARGVGPLSHAYRTACDPGDGRIPADCRDGAWRVVTESGTTYHVPQAHKGMASSLVISRDGRRIAYYADRAKTFVVRELAGGTEVTAPVRIPEAWLGSISRLLLSDDGRFLAFSKMPALADPAMLIDMRERMTRPLPNGWAPIGLSADGNTITLAQFSPKARLRTISYLWVTSTAGNATSVTLPRHYYFGPLADDGETLVALQENVTADSVPCVPGSLTHLDPKTGRVRRVVRVTGLPMTTHKIYLRAWLSPTEITAVALPLRTCTGVPHPRISDIGPEDPEDSFDAPFVTFTSYALNVETGKARLLPATYTAQNAFSLALPGAGGTP